MKYKKKELSTIILGLKAIKQAIIDKKPEHKYSLGRGMCSFNVQVNCNATALIVDRFIEDNRGFFNGLFDRYHGFWWKPGDMTPRLIWLNETIRKLERV